VIPPKWLSLEPFFSSPASNAKLLVLTSGVHAGLTPSVFLGYLRRVLVSFRCCLSMTLPRLRWIMGLSQWMMILVSWSRWLTLQASAGHGGLDGFSSPGGAYRPQSAVSCKIMWAVRDSSDAGRFSTSEPHVLSIGGLFRPQIGWRRIWLRTQLSSRWRWTLRSLFYKSACRETPRRRLSARWNSPSVASAIAEAPHKIPLSSLSSLHSKFVGQHVRQVVARVVIPTLWFPEFLAYILAEDTNCGSMKPYNSQQIHHCMRTQPCHVVS